jgi:hypothetical protein
MITAGLSKSYLFGVNFFIKKACIIEYLCYICNRNDKQLLRFFKNLKCENSSVGRARPCQGRGRGFEPRFSLKHHIMLGW